MTVLESGFWSKVDRSAGPDGCWPWTAYRFAFGYGGAWDPQARRLEGAHRAAWRLTNGPIPDGLCILHRCDNPPCCNPAHLFVGTQLENIADRHRKGRTVDPPLHIGEDNPGAKLTEAQVREIRAAYATGESRRSLAARFGMSAAGIRLIVWRQRWKHVKDDLFPEATEVGA